METKFKIGDEVVLSNSGGNYSTYEFMANIMELSNYTDGITAPINERLEIINIKNHTDFTGYGLVYAVQDNNGNQYLTSDKYMSLYTPKKPSKLPTRVTYEKVTDLSNDEVAKAMIDGAVFYSVDGEYVYSWDGKRFVNQRGEHISIVDSFYRRIEKEIDWRDTLREALEEDDVEWWENILDIDDGYIEIVSARFDKEAMRYLWKELCRTFEGEEEQYGDE